MSLGCSNQSFHLTKCVIIDDNRLELGDMLKFSDRPPSAHPLEICAVCNHRSLYTVRLNVSIMCSAFFSQKTSVHAVLFSSSRVVPNSEFSELNWIWPFNTMIRQHPPPPKIYERPLLQDFSCGLFELPTYNVNKLNHIADIKQL